MARITKIYQRLKQDLCLCGICGLPATMAGRKARTWMATQTNDAESSCKKTAVNSILIKQERTKNEISR
jgi:hypothetical protein